jgi:hypothetical protein
LNSLYSACPWQMPVSIFALISFVRRVSPITWNTKIEKQSFGSMQTCCSLNEDIIEFFDQLCLLSAPQHHDPVFPWLPEVQRKLRMQIL